MPDDGEIIPLAEQRERADDKAAAEIAKAVEGAAENLFTHQIHETLTHDRVWPPIDAAAAGGLGVAVRDLARVDLPATYKTAVAALRECSRIDEVLVMRNTATALAAYAQMAKNGEMLALAVRIRARAIRRCGELLREIEAARGRRTDLELRAGDLPKSTRSQHAASAGLSEHQSKTALRIANIPHAAFESAIERSQPATITALAERGRAAGPRPPWKPPQTEQYWLQVEIAYRRDGTIEEIAVEHSTAVLMAAWRMASPAARKRFLAIIGAQQNP